MIVEGKLDRVKGSQVLLTTGRYGFRSYDVSDPAHPRALDTFLPEGILGENGYWQDEDMVIDKRRKLIIGALDPRHDDVDQTSCPGIGTSGTKNRLPGLSQRLLRDLLRQPAQAQAGGPVRGPALGPHGQLRRRLPLHLDRRPRPPQRPAGPLPRRVHRLHRGRPRRRPADLGHRPARPGEPEDVRQADRPAPQRRCHRLLARRERGRERHRLDQRPRRHPGLRHRGQPRGPVHGPRAEGNPVEPGPGGRRRDRRGQPAARPTSCTTRCGRWTARRGRPG